MSTQGKSLQDIYDSGANKLDELEQGQKGGLTAAAEDAVQENGKLEAAFMQNLENSAQELDTELQSCLAGFKDGISATIKAEHTENEKFMATLRDRLSLTFQNFSVDLEHLKESIIEKFNMDAESCLDIQGRNTKELVGKVKSGILSTESRLELMSHNELADFTNSGPKEIMKIVEKAYTASNELFTDFSEHLQAIQEKAEQTVDTLKTDSENGLSRIKLEAENLEKLLSDTANQMTARMEEDCQETRITLNTTFEEMVSKSVKLEESLSRQFSKKLTSSCEKSKQSVSNELGSLRSGTTSLLEQVTKALIETDTNVKSKANEMSQSFTSDLEQKLSALRQHYGELSGERQKLLAQLTEDLKEIELGFDKKLTELTGRCLEDLSDACVAAESAMTATHNSCAGEFKKLAESQKKQMNAECVELINQAEVSSTKAVNAIRRAAGDAPVENKTTEATQVEETTSVPEATNVEDNSPPPITPDETNGDVQS